MIEPRPAIRAEANPYTPFYFFAALVLIVFAFNMISRKMIAKKR